MTIFGSIRARFTGWYLAVLAILLIAMSIGTYVVLHRVLNAELEEAISRRADELLRQPDFVAQMMDGRFAPPLGEAVGLLVPMDDGWEVFGLQMADASSLVAAIDASVGEPVFVTLDAEGQPRTRFFLMKYVPQAPPRPVGAADGPLLARAALEEAILVVAQPTDAIDSALAALRNTLLLAVPLTLILSAGGGLFLIRRALRPVDRMIATAHAIEETDLARRVPVQSRDELGRLGRTLNSMFDRLEQAFERQRQFTDDASHELRTPLSVIEAEVTLALRRERSQEEYRDVLATISEETNSMHRLVDQLLMLARGEVVDRATLAKEPVDLEAVVHEVVAALGPLAQEQNITLSTETSSLQIEADPVRIRRLVVNLVGNAIRYTEPGGSVVLSIADAGGDVVLRVEDTGIGIAPEHLQAVFDRFVRLDSSRHRGNEEKGSGLGLAICEQIVELHGGSIDVASTPGQGSTFTVRLPRYNA